MLDGTAKDFRYGLRLLAKNPAFTSVAVLSLALGIGANTAIFTLIDAVLLRTLPVKNPQELVSFRIDNPENVDQSFRHNVDGNSENSFSYAAFTEMRARNQVLSDLFGFKVHGRLNVQVNGDAEL